jgi:mannitol/fructose-specific phosphotransferase system IIA component (Ntr-type)
VLRMIATNINTEGIFQRLLNAKDASEVYHIFSEVRMPPPTA